MAHATKVMAEPIRMYSPHVGKLCGCFSGASFLVVAISLIVMLFISSFIFIFPEKESSYYGNFFDYHGVESNHYDTMQMLGVEQYQLDRNEFGHLPSVTSRSSEVQFIYYTDPPSQYIYTQERLSVISQFEGNITRLSGFLAGGINASRRTDQVRCLLRRTISTSIPPTNTTACLPDMYAIPAGYICTPPRSITNPADAVGHPVISPSVSVDRAKVARTVVPFGLAAPCDADRFVSPSTTRPVSAADVADLAAWYMRTVDPYVRGAGADLLRNANVRVVQFGDIIAEDAARASRDSGRVLLAVAAAVYAVALAVALCSVVLAAAAVGQGILSLLSAWVVHLVFGFRARPDIVVPLSLAVVAIHTAIVTTTYLDVWRRSHSETRSNINESLTIKVSVVFARAMRATAAPSLALAAAAVVAAWSNVPSIASFALTVTAAVAFQYVYSALWLPTIIRIWHVYLEHRTLFYWVPRPSRTGCLPFRLFTPTVPVPLRYHREWAASREVEITILARAGIRVRGMAQQGRGEPSRAPTRVVVGPSDAPGVRLAASPMLPPPSAYAQRPSPTAATSTSAPLTHADATPIAAPASALAPTATGTVPAAPTPPPITPTAAPSGAATATSSPPPASPRGQASSTPTPLAPAAPLLTPAAPYPSLSPSPTHRVGRAPGHSGARGRSGSRGGLRGGSTSRGGSVSRGSSVLSPPRSVVFSGTVRSEGREMPIAEYEREEAARRSASVAGGRRGEWGDDDNDSDDSDDNSDSADDADAVDHTNAPPPPSGAPSDPSMGKFPPSGAIHGGNVPGDGMPRGGGRVDDLVPRFHARKGGRSLCRPWAARLPRFVRAVDRWAAKTPVTMATVGARDEPQEGEGGLHITNPFPSRVFRNYVYPIARMVRVASILAAAVMIAVTIPYALKASAPTGGYTATHPSSSRMNTAAAILANQFGSTEGHVDPRVCLLYGLDTTQRPLDRSGFDRNRLGLHGSVRYNRSFLVGPQQMAAMAGTCLRLLTRSAVGGGSYSTTPAVMWDPRAARFGDIPCFAVAFSRWLHNGTVIAPGSRVVQSEMVASATLPAWYSPPTAAALAEHAEIFVSTPEGSPFAQHIGFTRAATGHGDASRVTGVRWVRDCFTPEPFGNALPTKGVVSLWRDMETESAKGAAPFIVASEAHAHLAGVDAVESSAILSTWVPLLLVLVTNILTAGGVMASFVGAFCSGLVLTFVYAYVYWRNYSLGVVESYALVVVVGIASVVTSSFSQSYHGSQFLYRQRRARFATMTAGPSTLFTALVYIIPAIIVLFSSEHMLTRFVELTIVTLTYALLVMNALFPAIMYYVGINSYFDNLHFGVALLVSRLARKSQNDALVWPAGHKPPTDQWESGPSIEDV